MKEDEKQKSQPAQKTATTANVKARPNKQQENQKRISLILAFLLVFIIFAAIAVPVSYIPFLNNLAHKFGLPTAITRQLTLLDLALSSLGVETSAMKAAFAQKEIIEEPQNPTFYSRFEPEISHLINAREAYYHEFERTHRRPDEISGVYKDGKAVDTPELAQGQVGGVRSLPEEDYLSDTNSDKKQGLAAKDSLNGSSGFGTKSGGVSYTVDSAEGAASAANERKARQSIDKDDDKADDKDPKSAKMPGFVSSVYANNPHSNGGTQGQASSQTVDINNSRMIKPLLKGGTFGVSRKETPLETFVGNSDFAKNLSNLRSFGGHDVLGFYIADDAPKNTGRGTFQKFGTSGEDAINSYFYSHVAVGRKYRTSAKYLAELAFSGERVNNEEILVARGQKEDRAPSAAEGDSPLSVMGTLQENMRKCNTARSDYLETTKETRKDFAEKKEYLKRIARNEQDITDGAVKRSAPGSCEETLTVSIIGFPSSWCEWLPWLCVSIHVDSPTAKVRKKWNETLDELLELCGGLQSAEKNYVEKCNMEYDPGDEDTQDTCNSIKALKLDGGTQIYDINFWNGLYEALTGPGGWELMPCNENVKWTNTNPSPTFNGTCNNDKSCESAIDSLFENIENSVSLSGGEGFPF